jgi:hypothetical protein
MACVVVAGILSGTINRTDRKEIDHTNFFCTNIHKCAGTAPSNILYFAIRFEVAPQRSCGTKVRFPTLSCSHTQGNFTNEENLSHR